MTHINPAIVIHSARDLRIEDRPLLKPGLGEVLIELQTGGICGSDLHYYKDGGFGPIKLREPMVLGHEVSGRVAALGPDIDGFDVGQLIGSRLAIPTLSNMYLLPSWPTQSLSQHAVLWKRDALSSYPRCISKMACRGCYTMCHRRRPNACTSRDGRTFGGMSSRM